MVKNHIKIVLSKFLLLKNDIFNIDTKIKISYITDLIYFEDIFVINDVIYINYLYIKRVFFSLEENNYSNMNEVYITDTNEIYDKNLLKLLTKNLIFLSQNRNTELWIKQLKNTEMIDFIDMNNVEINNNIIQNPSTLPINNKICVYDISNKKYCSLNVIISNIDYSPYYEKKIFEIITINNNNILIEVDFNKKISSNIFEDIAITISEKLFL